VLGVLALGQRGADDLQAWRGGEREFIKDDAYERGWGGCARQDGACAMQIRPRRGEASASACTGGREGGVTAALCPCM
jgi:hypothetical protein